MADTNIFADEIFGFHAQQAVEKALKAWLALLGVEYPRTHDLSFLLNMLKDQGQNVESLYDLIEFNPYAVQYRYEAFEEIGNPLDRSNVTDHIADLPKNDRGDDRAGSSGIAPTGCAGCWK